MINIHERLLNEADEQELYLLLNIARYMDMENFAFPSNKTLVKLTKWSLKKVRKVKGKCIEKKFFEVNSRYRPDGGQTSDGFTVTTDTIGVFVNLKGKGTPPAQNDTPPGTQNREGPPAQNDTPNEVLVNISNTYGPIIDFLNEKTGSRYRAGTDGTQRKIRARLNDGFQVDDFKRVIAHMAAKWRNDAKMAQYLRPETLFGTKFESYLNDAIRAGQKAEAQKDVELSPELEAKYNEYIAHITKTHPGITAIAAFLSKAEYKLFKERKYLAGLGYIGEPMERKALTTAHNHYEQNHPDAVKYRSVWEYHVARMAQIIRESTTI